MPNAKLLDAVELAKKLENLVNLNETTGKCHRLVVNEPKTCCQLEGESRKSFIKRGFAEYRVGNLCTPCLAYWAASMASMAILHLAQAARLTEAGK